MIVHLSAFLMHLLLQPEATSGAGEAAGGAGSGGLGCSGMQMAIMAGVFALTYFLLLRPERQKQIEAEKLQASLRVGMKVRTTSGILGEILRLNEDGRSVTLGIADKVRINILRANVAGPEVEVADKAPEAKGYRNVEEKPSSDKPEEKKA